MKVEKDLREADGVQDERRNGKTGGNSARSFAVLTLCAVFGDGYFSGDKDICRK